ncbi:nicotinate (nicotinamide) nucleotide adenylyltransferase [Solimicrobium silvestre]|uniref:Probable nicotinate-nucleotide adenylyltransferase n=1 Tax=Solimicrobium silvestre TaxID=2099400 RepID=A0A2S9GYN0_9BURK|nr:nicotinate (nicotinamide) nucleotide adenylyltransferase [Solimicrobium silvestre]PRC92821.1 nicotinate nucleotide adenylyltransferase [Solimicrobium silvestre]
MSEETGEAKTTNNQCIAIFGGSFDPVHSAHVALTELFNNLLKPTQLRIIPTGWSWQKTAFKTSPQQRIAMLSLAFAELSKQTSLIIDVQEIKRAELGIPSYSIDTLSILRNEFGASASLIFLMGADQLQQLQSWQNWQRLFELAHIAVVARPGFKLDAIDNLVANEFKQRAGSVEQLRNRPCGHTYLCADLAIDISSTQVRDGKNLSLLPPKVLDYIQQHHLY